MGMPTKAITYFTSEEVAKHNIAKDLWVIMNRKVYDVSKFYKFHPGGPAILLQFGGKDATAPASAAHKSIMPSNVMKEFEIGYVRMEKNEAKKPSRAEESETIKIMEIPKPPAKFTLPQREKTHMGKAKHKQESSQYDYGPRAFDGCPAIGNEHGMLKDLRSVNRLKGAPSARSNKVEAPVDDEAKQERHEREQREKEMAELQELAASIQKATAEGRSNAAQEERDRAVAQEREKEIQKQREREMAERQAEEKARRAEQEALEMQARAEREIKIRQEEELAAAAARQKRAREKLAQEAREKASLQAWEQNHGQQQQPGTLVSSSSRSDSTMSPRSARSPNTQATHQLLTCCPSPCAAKNSCSQGVTDDGYKVGDHVYWMSGKQSFPNGDLITFGSQGKCTGGRPAEKRIVVKFDGTESAQEVAATCVCKDPPSIPGGFKLGEVLYFVGKQQIFSNGDELTFGIEGEVQGRSCTGDAGADDKRVKAHFKNHAAPISVLITQVRREPPEIPGGFSFGDTVYYAGKKTQKFSNGDTLVIGNSGRITGCGTTGDVADEGRVKVRFQGTKGSLNVFVSELSRKPPIPEEVASSPKDGRTPRFNVSL